MVGLSPLHIQESKGSPRSLYELWSICPQWLEYFLMPVSFILWHQLFKQFAKYYVKCFCLAISISWIIPSWEVVLNFKFGAHPLYLSIFEWRPDIILAGTSKRYIRFVLIKSSTHLDLFKLSNGDASGSFSSLARLPRIASSRRPRVIHIAAPSVGFLAKACIPFQFNFYRSVYENFDSLYFMQKF